VSDRTARKGSNAFLVTTPAPPEARRRALLVVIVSSVAFCALAPFARVPLPRIEAFVPIYESILALNDLLTACFLIVALRRSQLRALLFLASGYFFTALMAVPLVLTFPGLFTSAGALGAGPQTSAWLDTFRHGIFPILMIGYTLLKRGEAVSERLSTRTPPKITPVGAGTVVGVCLLALLATAGHQLLPQITQGHAYTTQMIEVNVAVLLLSLIALAVLRSQPSCSILDLWLMVVLCAWIFDVTLSTVLNTGRFDIGFYAGRLYGLLAASIVPIILLIEASRLYGRLDEAVAVAEERNAELSRSREELAQAHRLEAIGQLTGGIAHDFNNLLTVVIGNLGLIMGARDNPEKIEQLAQSAMKAAQRGALLVQQLLTYARKQITRPQIVDLNQLIVAIESLIRRVIGEQIEVVTVLSPVLAPTRIDPAQFEAAILNLVINSRDAMAGGGRITIETCNVVVGRPSANDNSEVTPGPYVMVSLSDSGTGMTPAVLARAFDPFFTTKDVGKGSGLGLSQVYGFAKTAGGHVKIYSELGNGTTVKLYLPKASDRLSLVQDAALETVSPQYSGDETILVVEDDEDVLTVLTENLRELGYRVVTAVNAGPALEVLKGDQAVNLLLSDVIMPGDMNGVQLAIEARRIRPNVKVLLTSGYSAVALSADYGLPGDLSIMDKPYRRDELARKVRLAIDG
jgi:signal transduction histidine kinase